MEKSFDEKCYEVLKKVPAGKVVTYGQIAAALGKIGGAQAVGNALHRNNNSYCKSNIGSKKDLIPCHRVVKSDGSLGGFAFGECKKIDLLKKEGVLVINGKIDLEKYGYRFV